MSLSHFRETIFLNHDSNNSAISNSHQCHFGPWQCHFGPRQCHFIQRPQSWRRFEAVPKVPEFLQNFFLNTPRAVPTTRQLKSTSFQNCSCPNPSFRRRACPVRRCGAGTQRGVVVHAFNLRSCPLTGRYVSGTIPASHGKSLEGLILLEYAAKLAKTVPSTEPLDYRSTRLSQFLGRNGLSKTKSVI